jgi:hypothetical protein
MWPTSTATGPTDTDIQSTTRVRPPRDQNVFSGRGISVGQARSRLHHEASWGAHLVATGITCNRSMGPRRPSSAALASHGEQAPCRRCRSRPPGTKQIRASARGGRASRRSPSCGEQNSETGLHVEARDGPEAEGARPVNYAWRAKPRYTSRAASMIRTGRVKISKLPLVSSVSRRW